MQEEEEHKTTTTDTEVDNSQSSLQQPPPTPLMEAQQDTHGDKEETAKESKVTNTQETKIPSLGTEIPVTVTPSLSPSTDVKPAANKRSTQKEKQLMKQKETRKLRETSVRLPTANVKEITIEDVLELKMSRKNEYSSQNPLSLSSTRTQPDDSGEGGVTRYRSFPIFKPDSVSSKGKNDLTDDDILSNDYLEKEVTKSKDKKEDKHTANEEGNMMNKEYDPFQERNKRWDKEKEEMEALATRYTGGSKRKQETTENENLEAKNLDENSSESMDQQEVIDGEIIENEASSNSNEMDEISRSASVQELDKLLPQETQEEEEEFMSKCRKRIKQNKVLGSSDLFTKSSSLLGSGMGSQQLFSSSSLLTSQDSMSLSMFPQSVKRTSSTSADVYHDHNSNSEIISNDSRSSSLLMARNSLRKSNTIKSMDSASKVKKALFSTVIQSSATFGTPVDKVAKQSKEANKKQGPSEPPKKVQKKAVQKQLSSFFK